MIARVAFLVLAMAASAAAYPQFQLSSGTVRCSQCHLSPAGGGLLAPWGMDEAGDTIARGGNGRFLHGAVTLPDWLFVGGDIRLAALANNVGATDGTELAAFPMQVDLAASVRAGAFVALASVGARGVVRSGAPTSPPSPFTAVMDPSLASYVESREHYVMWQPDSSGVGGYARIGRFAAPYGLRLADHTAYVRRYLGYNLLEETYGASGGWLGDAVEVHATAFVYDPIQYASRHEVGGAAMLELHPDDRYVIGASARAGIGLAGASTRFESGIHTKLWLEDAKLLVQGEADGVREVFDGGGGRWQLAAYTGPVFIPTRGVYTGLAYEAFAEDLHVRGVTRHAADAWASWFVRAHFEIMLSGRAQLVGPGERAYLGMLQLHYTL